MVNRRDFLKTGAVAATATAVTMGTASIESGHKSKVYPCRNPGKSADYFPNVMVTTQNNERALLYDDLIKDKIVMINFMSIKGDEVYPVTANLVKVQRLLKDRVGKDIVMISITLDPEHDTPKTLKAFADKHGVGPGWFFITGEPADMHLLHTRIFLRRETPTMRAMNVQHGRNCSVGLVRYGNEQLRRWGSFPAKVAATSIAERFSWIGFREGSTVRKA